MDIIIRWIKQTISQQVNQSINKSFKQLRFGISLSYRRYHDVFYKNNMECLPSCVGHISVIILV